MTTGPRSGTRTAIIVAIATAFLSPDPGALALDVVGYAPSVNDRFADGYPVAPVTNSGTAFVGSSYSWLGVGWAATDATKSFGFITPRHYVVARHYGGAGTITVLAADGTLATVTQATVTDTGYGLQLIPGQTVGDLAIGTLTESLPSSLGLPRYAVLDLNLTSTSNSSYAGLPVLLYGRGANAAQSPRIARTSITLSGSVTAGFQTSQAAAALEDGDSGSPDFIPWVNPDGKPELTIIGNNAARGGTVRNLFNFLGLSPVMGAINQITNTHGHALRVVGDPARTWVGAGTTAIGAPAAWGLPDGTPIPDDRFVAFDGAVVNGERRVTVDAPTMLRGLFFRSTGSGSSGFTVSGTGPLTLGRGGITNYDSSRQTFTTPITLAASQVWNVGAGGVTVAALETGTGGWLLEIDGPGATRIGGDISGNGGLATSGRRLELAGANSHTGPTWVHGGTLVLGHPSAVRSSRLIVAAGGTATVATRTPATVGGLELAAGGLVDIGAAGMSVVSGPAASSLFAALAAGRGDGSWNGTSGITSAAVAAAVAAGEERAVGWVEDGVGGVSLAFAAVGDTNIDGLVDGLDAANFVAGNAFDTLAAARWIDGDFNYDGVVDVLDASGFVSTGLFDAGPYIRPQPGAVAVVPEPGLSQAWIVLVGAVSGAVFVRTTSAAGPASGRSGSGRRTPPRSTPSWRPAGSAACIPCRRPGTGSA